MILAVLFLGGLGLYFLVRGDGPARLVGIALLLLAGGLAALIWIAVAVERPPLSLLLPVAGFAHG